MEKKDLIVVEKLPVIREQLKQLSLEIDEKVKVASSLVCTEDSVKEVKRYRAELNSLFNELEDRRKEVKNSILAPYNSFETIYKECVTEKFGEAKQILDKKVNDVENELKRVKTEEVITYFNEYALKENIDFVSYEQAKINVTLSASMKSLKEQVKSFIDKIVSDLALIETQEHKTEILVEYKQSLNASAAIMNVSNRFKAIEEEKKRQEELARIKEQEQLAISKVEATLDKPLTAPEVVVEPKKEDIYTLNFKVTATKDKLKALKQFLEDGGYKYE